MEEKLMQYIQGTILSADEVRDILDWIDASELNQKRYNELKNLWVLTGLKEVKPQHSQKFFENGNSAKLVSIKPLLSILKYAAVFIFAFLIGALSLYFTGQKQINQLSEEYNEILVPNGEKSVVTLYDGTKVWLNSGTTFKYPVVFNGRQRNVFVEGEAYFEVAKDERKPFNVHAGAIDVLVLGTKFNVYSYPEDDIFITLEEGSVNIFLSGLNKKFELSPGEQFEFSKQSKTPKLFKVDTELYTSWKENILRFENAPLSEILKKMERWYDVKIVVDENLDISERYTTTIKTESLREMLQVLSLTSDMKYEINETIVKISKP